MIKSLFLQNMNLLTGLDNLELDFLIKMKFLLLSEII
jgi:hypothetical protein